MQEKVDVKDSAPQAMVVKGGAEMTPKELEEALEKQKKNDPHEKITLDVSLEIYKELKEFLEVRCKVKKLNFEDVLSSLILDGARMHFNKGCPFCLPAKLDKQAKDRAARKAFEEKKEAKRKSKKKTQKESRRKNRGK